MKTAVACLSLGFLALCAADIALAGTTDLPVPTVAAVIHSNPYKCPGFYPMNTIVTGYDGTTVTGAATLNAACGSSGVSHTFVCAVVQWKAPWTTFTIVSYAYATAPRSPKCPAGSLGADPTRSYLAADGSYAYTDISYTPYGTAIYIPYLVTP